MTWRDNLIYILFSIFLIFHVGKGDRRGLKEMILWKKAGGRKAKCEWDHLVELSTFVVVFNHISSSLTSCCSKNLSSSSYPYSSSKHLVVASVWVIPLDESSDGTAFVSIGAERRDFCGVCSGVSWWLSSLWWNLIGVACWKGVWWQSIILFCVLVVILFFVKGKDEDRFLFEIEVKVNFLSSYFC